MAISDSQKIDLLWKKVGFGKTKTDTNANKKAPNEPTQVHSLLKTQIYGISQEGFQEHCQVQTQLMLMFFWIVLVVNKGSP